MERVCDYIWTIWIFIGLLSGQNKQTEDRNNNQQINRLSELVAQQTDQWSSLCVSHHFLSFWITKSRLWLLIKKSHWVSHHGVRLPRARLSVGEDAGVVALERRLQHVGAQIFKNLQIKQTNTQKKKSFYFCSDVFKVSADVTWRVDRSSRLHLRFKPHVIRQTRVGSEQTQRASDGDPNLCQNQSPKTTAGGL